MPKNAADTASGQTLFVQVTANFANIFRLGDPRHKALRRGRGGEIFANVLRFCVD